MATLGSQGTFIYGNNSKITFNANVYAIARTIKLKFGNKLKEYPVVGTDIPIINTEEFHGELTMTVIWSTENGAGQQFGALLTLTAGSITPINFILDGADVSGVPGTPGTHSREIAWTGTFWPADAAYDYNGPEVAIATVTGIFNAHPTLS